MSVNRATIVGHLGSDPDVRYTQTGSAVANLSIATTYRSRDGDEQTEWHRVACFGKAAEYASDKLRKGSKVYVDGRLHTSQYTDRDGNERRVTEIYARQVEAWTGNGAPAARQEKERPTQTFTDDDVPF